MATTAEKITALETALASGELTVRYADGSVTYRSAAELQKALAYFRRRLAEESGKRGGAQVSVAGYFRG